MKQFLCLIAVLLFHLSITAEPIPFGKGQLSVENIAPNAVRIRYTEGPSNLQLPEWIYTSTKAAKNSQIKVNVDANRQVVEISNQKGQVVFRATSHQLRPNPIDGLNTSEARLVIQSPKDEKLFGLGQFQDGYLNIRGLSRRLTQVNTQISIPMMISSKGYGLLWNNYGMTEYNPCSHEVKLQPSQEAGGQETVNVTSTEGSKREVRAWNTFDGQITVTETGDYALLLDVGQSMARKHQLSIDGKPVINMQNTWLPPTASTIVHLTAGTHQLNAALSRGDKPTVYYQLVKDESVLQSPLAEAVDYTVFVGSADEIIASYRNLTGPSPMMPLWALGYIHCRERFHSQDELLSTAQRFRKEGLPVDVVVQDWQYWGKNGWNSMTFDSDHYPNPRQMTDSLHAMNQHLMLSVWSKIDKQSVVGKQMERDGYYIPGTDWIDFFHPAAADAYWKNFSERLVPLGIDAWWQDATEPENDDLVGRRVMGGKYPGELFRNVYPLLVNKTVYEGLTKENQGNRPLILTRCGFPGIQRYGSALWSGDVGNDWETLRRQITAGLGMQSAGIPWWTYDAGGFFRPQNQYNDSEYIERMLRWIEISVYLPLMRVHGYMSNTEPWNYGQEAQDIIKNCLQERYRLLPYIYSQAAAISFNGYTLMRPLVFDFPNDPKALQQNYEYMFGPSLLISPVTEPGVKSWKTYLPKHDGGWYDYHTGKHYDGGQTVTTDIDKTRIPVFVKAGSIIPVSTGGEYAEEALNNPLEIRVYRGQDTTFDLYLDNGKTIDYLKGKKSVYRFTWKESKKKLKVKKQWKVYPVPQYKIVYI